MPTLVSSACLWYSALHRRWLTPHEALMLQGFPVRVHWSYGHQCCSFASRHAYETTKGDHSDNDLYSEEKLALLRIRPGRQHVLKMAGNSMHTNVSRVAILYALTQISIDCDLLKLLQQSHRMERNPRCIKPNVNLGVK